ncbi:MAG: hypothetical protein Q9201_000682 [Fulgogasparrea decipioides]
MSCSACFQGTIHDGTPSGTETELHGLPTYIACPPPDVAVRGIIVIVPDAIGWTFTNTRCLADEMAKEGNFKVYLPEFMNGTHISYKKSVYSPDIFEWSRARGIYVPLRTIRQDVARHRLLGYDFETVICTSFLIPFHNDSYCISTRPETLEKTDDTIWAKTRYYALRVMLHIVPFLYRGRFSVTWPRVHDFMTAVSTKEARDLPLGAAGFCWGGRHVVNLASLPHPDDPQKLLIDAAFIAHPGPLELPGEIERIRAPFLMAIGDDDYVVGMKEVEKIKAVLTRKENLESEVVVYPGAKHGFAVRGNPGDEKDKRRGDEAREQAVRWFQRWFRRVGEE